MQRNMMCMSMCAWIQNVWVHAHRYETCGVRNTHTLTMNAGMKKGWYTVFQGIPEYRVIEASEMLPLQKLDEEWGSCRIFWDSCTCVWVCLGGKAGDWLAHSKWEELHQEELWHTNDIIGKPQDSPKWYKRAKWVAQSTRTTQEYGLRSVSSSFSYVLGHTLWCIEWVLSEMVD